jgi:hypothetical protein
LRHVGVTVPKTVPSATQFVTHENARPAKQADFHRIADDVSSFAARAV